MSGPARIAVHWRALSELAGHWRLWQEWIRRTGCELLVLHEQPASLPAPSLPGLAAESVTSRLAVHPALRWVSGWRKPLEIFRPEVLLALDEPYCLQTLRFARWAHGNHIPLIFLSCQNIDRRLPFPFERFERQVLEISSGAWFLNGEAWERSRRRGFRSPGKVIPLGVDLEAFDTVAETKLSQQADPRGPFAVGYVGRLVAEKGVDDLLRACGQIGAELVIVGSGPDESRLRALARESGVEVRWKGVLGGRELIEAYGAMDVLVLPSRTTPTWKEQFGRVLVEAMAAGIPVIGSDSGEIPKVLAGAGWVYPEGDVDCLAEGLGRLRSDPALRLEWGAKGRSKALADYTWDRVAEGLAGLLREAVPSVFS